LRKEEIPDDIPVKIQHIRYLTLRRRIFATATAMSGIPLAVCGFGSNGNPAPRHDEQAKSRDLHWQD
jgi:hypothetical protein